MKTFHGKYKELSKNFLGAIIDSQEGIFTLKDVIGNLLYIGIQEENVDFVIQQNNIGFNIGDVVQINTNGHGIVLFDKSSNDNALYITDKCNNACIMCPQPLKKKKESYLESNLGIISLLLESPEVIGITGGEPTEEWDELIKILNLLTLKHPNTIVQLLTNGRIFSDIDKVEEIVNSNKNILFCIPLYSELPDLHDSIVSSPGAFYETINGLYNLAKFKQPIELRTVIMKQNYFRLPEWSDWVCMNLPFLSHVAIMGLELTNNALKNNESIWIDPIDYGKELFKSIQIFRRHDLPSFVYNHQLCTVDPRIWNNCSRTISDFKVIYLEECQFCSLKEQCGGLFNSAKQKHSIGIKAVKEKQW